MSSFNTSSSYLPSAVIETLSTLESTLTIALTRTFHTLPESLQTQLVTIASSPHLSRTNLLYVLRLIVIIATYILFRPHLEALLRRATGAPDPRKTELENRLRFLRDLKDGKIQPQGGVEVIDGKVVVKPRSGVNVPKGATASAAGAVTPKKKGKGKVVKLLVPGEEEDQVPDKSQSPVSTATPSTRASTRRRKA